MIMPLYGLVAGISSQNELVKKYCFDICGKLVFGGINAGDGIGCLFVCQIPSDSCMCFDKQTDKAIGDVNGRPVFIRKLTENMKGDRNE